VGLRERGSLKGHQGGSLLAPPINVTMPNAERAANLAKTDFPDCFILDIQSMTNLLI
jgi:hypothetical protein